MSSAGAAATPHSPLINSSPPAAETLRQADATTANCNGTTNAPRMLAPRRPAAGRCRGSSTFFLFLCVCRLFVARPAPHAHSSIALRPFCFVATHPLGDHQPKRTQANQLLRDRRIRHRTTKPPPLTRAFGVPATVRRTGTADQTASPSPARDSRRQMAAEKAREAVASWWASASVGGGAQRLHAAHCC